VNSQLLLFPCFCGYSAQDARTSAASSLKAVLQKQKAAVDKGISASVDNTIAPSSGTQSQFFTPIQSSAGGGAVLGITTGIESSNGPRRQLFPTLKVDAPADFVTEAAGDAAQAKQPSQTVERVKALLLSATRASETPDRSVSPYSTRTNTPSSLISRGGRRPSGDIGEAKSRSASVDPPMKPFLKRSSRSLLGNIGKNMIQTPQPVIVPQPKTLTPADSVVAAALAPAEMALREDMQLHLDRLRLEMRAQQVETSLPSVVVTVRFDVRSFARRNLSSKLSLLRSTS
jgi:hypothetical protein